MRPYEILGKVRFGGINLREIGGYLSLDDFRGSDYYCDLIKLNNGTNALAYIVKAKKVKKVYIPDYLCDSIELMLKRLSCDCGIYRIGENFEIGFDEKLGPGEYLYLVNYYGQLSNQRIRELKDKHESIIVDNVHAFYQRPVEGVDTFYSCRKFFGIADGAYLSTDVELEERLERDISRDRMAHIIGSYEGKNSEYYGKYQEVERGFYSESIKIMSKLTENILRAVDYQRIATTRLENYDHLRRELSSLNILDLNGPKVPIAYPLYIEGGDVVRKALIERGIYVPTLWPNVIERGEPGTVSYRYAKNILPLPCDQRYGLLDMKYLVEVLRCIC